MKEKEEEKLVTMVIRVPKYKKDMIKNIAKSQGRYEADIIRSLQYFENRYNCCKN